MEMYLIIVLVILIVVGLWIVKIYNGLIRLKVRTNEAWSDIDVQLKRRYDLIPNLINTVKGYATHEKELFENVTKARSNAMNAQNPEEKAGAENMLSGALKSLFAVSENYPDLKANENFLELQRELSDTENKIQASRRFYNGNVRDLNTKIQIFPDSIVANMLRIGKREFFEIEDEKEKETPKVEF
ncbi:MAG: LemA family protein [Candidatus Pacebacteria bacterium]|nr:LemA family protein [Candidatus Paceibacterota bacterium]